MRRYAHVEHPWEVDTILFLHGHFLGTTGMLNGPKAVLFHGCSDKTIELIQQNGFDDRFASDGVFGKGLYFSPQACKAYSYAERYLLICEVALGTEHKRLLVKKEHATTYFNYEMLLAKDMRSVHHHPTLSGFGYNHHEHVVFHPTQCKPVYVVKMRHTSPGGGI